MDLQKKKALIVTTKKEGHTIPCSEPEGQWLRNQLELCSPQSKSTVQYKDVVADYKASGFEDFILFWFGQKMESLKEIGLLVL